MFVGLLGLRLPLASGPESVMELRLRGGSGSGFGSGSGLGSGLAPIECTLITCDYCPPSRSIHTTAPLQMRLAQPGVNTLVYLFGQHRCAVHHHLRPCMDGGRLRSCVARGRVRVRLPFSEVLHGRR